MIHHLARADDWAAAVAAGEYRMSTRGATLDEVGFIHASFAHQLDATAARHYASLDAPLVVLDIDPDRLPDGVLRVEPAAGGERFPHLYGPLPVDAVAAVRPVRLEGDRLVARPPG